MQMLPLEEQVGYDAEHNQGDDFLNDFELHQRERSAVVDEADSVGRHLAAVFKEGNSPRESYDAEKRPIGGDA